MSPLNTNDPVFPLVISIGSNLLLHLDSYRTNKQTKKKTKQNKIEKSKKQTNIKHKTYHANINVAF